MNRGDKEEEDELDDGEGEDTTTTILAQTKLNIPGPGRPRYRETSNRDPDTFVTDVSLHRPGIDLALHMPWTLGIIVCTDVGGTSSRGT